MIIDNRIKYKVLLWDAKSWLIGKDPDAGKVWKQRRGHQRMRGWDGYHELNGHEFEQTPGDSERRAAWGAAGHGVTRVRHDLATEPQWRQK